MDKILEKGPKEPEAVVKVSIDTTEVDNAIKKIEKLNECLKETKKVQELELLDKKLDKVISCLSALGKTQFAALILREHPTSVLARGIRQAVLAEGEEWARNDYLYCEDKKQDNSNRNTQDPEFPSFSVRRDRREAP